MTAADTTQASATEEAVVGPSTVLLWIKLWKRNSV